MSNPSSDGAETIAIAFQLGLHDTAFTALKHLCHSTLAAFTSLVSTFELHQWVGCGKNSFVSSIERPLGFLGVKGLC